MAKNIELKARVSDLEEVRRKLAAMPCRGEHRLHQTDTFFRVKQGRLKLREFDDGTGELIFYERPDQEAAKLSQYDRMPCNEPQVVLRALGSALRIRGVVKKRRQVFLIGNTRVHLDQVDGLGSFVEFEVVLQEGEPISAGERVAAELLQAIGIPSSDLVGCAYIDLFEKRAVERTGDAGAHRERCTST